jgi:hypothetical protein
MPISPVNEDAARLTNLVADARSLGLTVPAAVSDELALFRRLTADPRGTQSALTQAQTALTAAPIAKVDSALEALTDAALASYAAQALGETVKNIAVHRLHNAVFDQAPTWETETVDQFNQIVEDSQLNDVAGDLPDLTSLMSPVDMTRDQSRAVQRWVDAADLLNPLWSMYRRLAHFHGEDVGPDDVSGVATNLLLACRLGDPGSFRVAQSAVAYFAAISAGSDASRRYGKIGLFAVPPMCRYPLRLSTNQDALRIRRAIQPAA